MGLFPRFGGWINHNIQQLTKAESENAKSNNATAKEKKYYDEAEGRKQQDLWREAERKHPWYDPPPKMKVTTKKGISHMHIELTMGGDPDLVYELLTNPNNGPFFDIDTLGNQLLKNKSRKVLKEDGPRQIAKSEKAVAFEFLWWTGYIPITLIVDENKKELTAKYKKERMEFMKVFEGSYKVEPIYVDSERLCKNREPKTREEYKKCSGGQGKVASKVIMDQYFKPYPPLNLPPLSWYIHETTINTTETVLKMLQWTNSVMRGV